MNKGDLVKVVADQLCESRTDATKTVNVVLEAIKSGLAADGSVQLTGFGSFDVRSRKGRNGRNPKTGEPLWIRPANAIHFSPSSDFRSRVQDNGSPSD